MIARFYQFLCILILCFDVNFSQGASFEKLNNNLKNKENATRVTQIDLLIEEILNKQWSKDEKPCQQKILNILNGVKSSTLWATWIWDSMQSPTGVFYGSQYQLGNFDQCLKPPWMETHTEYRTQYCLVDIKLSDAIPKNIIIDPNISVQKYIDSLTKHKVTFNKFSWGLCIPVECNSKGITKFAHALFKQTHLGLLTPVVEVKTESCQISGNSEIASEGYDIKTFIVTLLAMVVTTSFICTIIKYNVINNPNIIGNRIIEAFCMKDNMEYLINTPKNDISVIHGCKFLTSCIVVVTHVWFLSVWIGLINPLELDVDIQRYHLNIFYHIDIVVDTYFMISGLLLMKILMSSGSFNPLWVILKRYLRLVFSVALLITLSVFVMAQYGDGPLWPHFTIQEINICKKTWWLSLLMLGNYVDTVNICYPATWTVYCDFHFSAIGTILIWIFRNNRRTGFALYTLLLLAALVTPGYVAYQQEFPAVLSFDVGAVKDYRNTMLGNPLYISSHLRAGPYFVGLGAGYLISTYKPSRKTYMPKIWCVIWFVLALATGVLITLMGPIFLDETKSYNIWLAVFYASLNRTIWALAMAFIVFICEYGTVPMISPFLKWQVFVPLSKLSYGLYLLHALIFGRLSAVSRTPLQHDTFRVFINTFGVLCISLIASFLIHVFFEAPMIKLMNIATHNRNTKSQSTQEKHDKNVQNKKKMA